MLGGFELGGDGLMGSFESSDLSLSEEALLAQHCRPLPQYPTLMEERANAAHEVGGDVVSGEGLGRRKAEGGELAQHPVDPRLAIAFGAVLLIHQARASDSPEPATVKCEAVSTSQNLVTDEGY